MRLCPQDLTWKGEMMTLSTRKQDTVTRCWFDFHYGYRCCLLHVYQMMKVTVYVKLLISLALVGVLMCVVILSTEESIWSGHNFIIRFISQRATPNFTLIKLAANVSLRDSPVLTLGSSSSYLKDMAHKKKSLTVVTGYIGIGKYEKVYKGFYRSIKDYVEWAEPYRYLLNPLVVYTDSDVFGNLMINLRNNDDMITKIIKINKETLWPYSLRRKIDKLFQNPDYPKFYPGTTYPDYTCATHSKLSILVDGLRRFNTSHYCWLDAGYLKYLRGKNKSFTLDVPRDFDNSKIGVTRVYDVTLNVSPKKIFHKQLNWIAGGMFLGIPDKILKFEKQYRQTVLRFLSQNLMAPEQQTLYAMYSNVERKRHPVDVELQTYIPGSMKAPHKSPFHFLGYAMYHEKAQR